MAARTNGEGNSRGLVANFRASSCTSEAMLQSNELVARRNGTFKSVLFYAIGEHGRDWGRFVPCLLRAYREILKRRAYCNGGPIETTSALHLNLCMEYSSGAAFNSAKGMKRGLIHSRFCYSAPEEYLMGLRERLAEANARPEDSCADAQRKYAGRYIRSIYKQFRKGDEFLWLEEEQGKLVGKWTGPVAVVEKLLPYSYLIELEGGTSLYVHVNKFGTHQARVKTVGTVFEVDSHFSDVHTLSRAVR